MKGQAFSVASFLMLERTWDKLLQVKDHQDVVGLEIEGVFTMFHVFPENSFRMVQVSTKFVRIFGEVTVHCFKRSREYTVRC